MSGRTLAILVVTGLVFLLILGFVYTPTIRGVVNAQDYLIQKVDEATSYKIKREVENSCRAMIASYEADRLVYEQYIGSDSQEERTWASQAMMRANRTASSYNNYILKNSYVWANNVPNDISQSLEVIKK